MPESLRLDQITHHSPLPPDSSPHLPSYSFKSNRQTSRYPSDEALIHTIITTLHAPNLVVHQPIMLPTSDDAEDSQDDGHEAQIQRLAQPAFYELSAFGACIQGTRVQHVQPRPAQVPSIDSVEADTSACNATRQHGASGERDEQRRGKRREGIWMYEVYDACVASGIYRIVS